MCKTHSFITMQNHLHDRSMRDALLEGLTLHSYVMLTVKTRARRWSIWGFTPLSSNIILILSDLRLLSLQYTVLTRTRRGHPWTTATGVIVGADMVSIKGSAFSLQSWQSLSHHVCSNFTDEISELILCLIKLLYILAANNNNNKAKGLWDIRIPAFHIPSECFLFKV